MKLQDIRKMARRYRIEPESLTKLELIREIQREKFGAAINGECDQSSCLWRDDCCSVVHGVRRTEH